MTDATELAEVKSAISAVLKAQSYKFEGREVTRADLSALQDRERMLEGKVSTAGRGMRMTGIRLRH